MIYLVTGSPGAGKSFLFSQLIVDKLSEGKIVVSNMLVNCFVVKVFGINIWDERKKFRNFYYFESSDFHLEILIDFLREKIRERDDWEEGDINIFLDESLFVINKRFFNKDFLKFLTVHRKFFCNVYISSQIDKQIDTSIRNMVDFHVKIRKLNELIPFFTSKSFRLIYYKNMNSDLFFFKPLFILPFSYLRFFSYQLYHFSQVLPRIYNFFDIAKEKKITWKDFLFPKKKKISSSAFVRKQEEEKIFAVGSGGQ